MTKLTLPTVITKIPENRVKDIEIEDVRHIYGQDSHVMIQWGYKGEETGHTLMIDADTYNDWLKSEDKLQFDWNDGVKNMSLQDYWDDKDMFDSAQDAKLYLMTKHVEYTELPDLPAIVKDFPNPNTYPVMHEAHAATMYGKAEDL